VRETGSTVRKRIREKMILPSFLIIGAARCGTTSLFVQLQQHPDVYLPPSKRPEPHFFLKEDEYRKGLRYYSNRFFTWWNGESAAGEASTSYIYQDYVPGRIHKHLPEVRLILLLRNPVDRAYSHYWYSVQNGLESLSFEGALKKEEERIRHPNSQFEAEVQPYAYLDRGRYYTQIRRYLRFFKREQLLILFFEDLKTAPVDLVRATFRFLNVDDSFVPPAPDEVHNQRQTARPPMEETLRRKLVEQFQDENEKLSDFTGRDLSHWNCPSSGGGCRDVRE
jgi:hypothetical protein